MRSESRLATVFVVGFLFVVLPVSMLSFPLALVCGLGLILLLISLVFGLTRFGNVLLVLAISTAPMTNVHVVGTINISDVLLVTAFVLLLPRLLTTPLKLPMLFAFGVVGFVVIGSLASLGNDQPGEQFGSWLNIVGGVIVIPLALAWWQPDRRSVVVACVGYTVSNALSALYSFVQDPYVDQRYQGLSHHPNVMALCQALGIALVPFLLQTVPARLRWIVVVAAGVSFYGVWISGSRAALLCVIALAVLYPMLRRSIPAALGLAAVSIPAMLLVLRVAQDPESSKNALGRLLGGGGAKSSSETREQTAREAIDHIVANPIIGGQDWGTAFSAHDVYLQVAAATGLFGLAAYAMILVALLRPLVFVAQPWGLLALPVLTYAMISAMDPSLGGHNIWLLLGLALSAQRLAAATPDTSDDASSLAPDELQPALAGRPA